MIESAVGLTTKAVANGVLGGRVVVQHGTEGREPCHQSVSVMRYRLPVLHPLHHAGGLVGGEGEGAWNGGATESEGRLVRASPVVTWHGFAE